MIVVSAGIIVKDGKILLAQRKPTANQALKWEFPGGKVEKNESPQAALVRELSEELGIQTETGRIFDARYVSDADRELLILFFFTKICGGQPKTIDCNGFEWTDCEHILEYDLAPTDRCVAEQLASEDREIKRRTI